MTARLTGKSGAVLAGFLAMLAISAIVTAGLLGVIWQQDTDVTVVNPSSVYSTIPTELTMMTGQNETFYIQVQNTAEQSMIYELVMTSQGCDVGLSNGSLVIEALPGDTAQYYIYVQAPSVPGACAVQWTLYQSTTEP